MEKPILVFKRSHTVTILTIILFNITFLSLSIFNIIKQGFSFVSLGFLCIFTIVPFFFILKEKKKEKGNKICVYLDHLTVKDVGIHNDKKIEKEIYFKEFCSLYCQSGFVASKEPISIQSGKQYYLLFEDRNKELVFTIDFSLFQSRKHLEQFFLFLREHYPHITYDSRIRSILREEDIFPNTEKYTGLIAFILFNILWFYALFHS